MSYDILLEYSKRVGWNENSMLLIACDYIDNQDAADTFEDFVAQQADFEDPPGKEGEK